MEEYINHPEHYTHNGKECIVEMEEKWGKLAVVAFCLLNSFKYNYRAGFKKGNSIKRDKEKANWYSEYITALYDRMNWFEKWMCNKFLLNK